MASQTITALGNAIINLVDRKTPIATANTVGMVKPDGSTINIDANGVISAESGSGHIGEIVKSLTPLNEAGLHLLDGSVIANGFYAQFVSHMASLYASNPSLFVTESEWQAAISAHGVCGKFVYDSAKKTVRLPKVTGIIEGTTDLNALGSLVNAGLPEPKIDVVYRQDSTSSGVYTDKYGTDGYTSGAVSNTSGTDEYMQTSLGKGVNAPFGAICTNPIYGKSNTVQPQTIKVLYYIVIAQSAKTKLQVNIDNIATDLNNKVSKSDLLEVQCVVETYVNGTSGYRIWSDGYCEQWGIAGGTADSYRTITLLKEFKDTSYIILFTETNRTTNDNSRNSTVITNNTTTKTFYAYMNRFPFWKACGYLA